MCRAWLLTCVDGVGRRAYGGALSALEGVQAELLRMGEDADVEVFLSWERRVVAAAA